MASWKGKSSGTALGYIIFIFLLKHVGLRSAYLLLRFISFYYIFLLPSATKNIYQYFRFRVGFSFGKSIISIYKNYYVFGQSIIDKVATWSGIKTNFTYSFDGDHYLKEINKDGKGAILISAHVGNWEIASSLLKELHSKINVVLLDAEHKNIKKTLDKTMTKRDLNIIPIRSDLSHVFKIANALRNNEVVCFHGDRFVDGSPTVIKKLLGKEAKFPEGPIRTIHRLNVPYSFVFAFKTGPKHYSLSATKGKLPSQNMDTTFNEYIALLEKQINKYPLQWFNYYDFWDMNLKGAKPR